MAFSEQKYETLKRFKKKHQLCDDDIRYAVDNNHLKVSTKSRPTYYVDKLTCIDQEPLKGKYEGFFEEGFIGVRPEDVWTILKKGRAKLRKFTSTEQNGPLFRLAENPPQPSILVHREDLIVFKKHEEEFKAVWETNEVQNSEPIKISGNYREIHIQGEKSYIRGDIQMRIIEYLHKAFLKGDPWVHSKTLTHEAGASTSQLNSLLGKKKIWQRIIESNQGGLYRLREPFIVLDHKNVE